MEEIDCNTLLMETKISLDTMSTKIYHKFSFSSNFSWALLPTSLLVFFSEIILDVSINHIFMLMGSWLS